MLPAHGDDDHLYFAGLLPYYAGELDYRVQVVYLTSHRWDNTVRAHEILNGLWATGVEAYPVLGYGLDFRVDSLEGSYRVYANNGISKEELVGFVVEQLRRFKPLVAVGHDIDGEYGHGMHKVYADLLMQAVAVSNDPNAYPELTQKYGTWDVPKTYLHLLETDPIVIDYDIPLESFDGLTAFQVSQQYGFPCHVSQHIYKAFIEWLYGKENEITKASQIERHNPCEFGLYRSTVGPDVQKNDFLENVVTYDQQLLLEQERLAQEKLELERQEQARKEQEQREQEQLAQEEADRLTEEEEQMLQELLAAQDALRRRNLTIALVFGGVIAIAFTVAYDSTKRRYEKDPALRKKNKKIKKRRK